MIEPEPAAPDRTGQPRYLGPLVAVARSARRGEYAVVHLRSGTFLRTDRLGARAVRILVKGGSDVEAMAVAERIEAGAAERARRLIYGLVMLEAMTPTQPARSGGRWRAKLLAVEAIGWTLSVLGSLTRLAPISLLAWCLKTLPATPIGRHVWLGHRYEIVQQLRSSGYADRSEAWLQEVSRGCASSAPLNWFFMYMSVALTPARLNRLVERIVDRAAVDELAERLRAAGPSVVVFLHEPLCVAMPVPIRARGIQVARTINPLTHGANVSEESEPLRYFGDPADLIINMADPLMTGAMLRHLKAGRSVHLALDRMAGSPTGEIELLGRSFARNDGPAWLAVRSGRPVIAINTYFARSGRLAIKTNPPLYPDPSLAPEQRVVDLSVKLYAYAEAAIREHPEAWAGWNYLDRIRGAHLQRLAPA